MKRSYFISWICDKDGSTAYGNVVYDIKGKINREVLDELKELIQKDAGIENVLILNFIKL